MSHSTNNLKVLARLCNSGMCPALYQDEQGRVFVQGSKLAQGTSTEMGIPDHEAVVEITPELIDFLRSSLV
ncbi:hypothetical protein IQ249_15350 [Lusitaniella coriacea LEGE 07157]|uniref:Uncharacterized protein n=1 Tax=Lusitaniella coriacea LEGE 07157 TaxID=945747 RepID=A0A8J7DXQ4_9CYAN|nr:hypothetical protein [Lusitaniella coriacea]MBE9117276.1 hypothetical protein [Lusitaniella coriacea LEGE 07157]